MQAVLATGQDVLVAQQAYWPTPSIAMERAQSQAVDPAYAGSPQVLTLKLQQPLWTGGRLTAQNQKALAAQAIESARLLEIQHTLALKALQTWTELVSNQQQQSILRNSVQTQTELLNKIQRRVDQGLSSQSEANYSSLRLQLAKQELNNAHQQEKQAWVRLKQWVPDVQDLSSGLQLQGAVTKLPNSTELALEIFNLSERQWELLCIEHAPQIGRASCRERVSSPV
mgnify:FL=1